MHQDDTGMDPKAWYRAACEQGGFTCDAAQTAAIDELEAFWQQLVEFKSRRDKFLGRSLLSPDVPRGLYIWGGVGRGKTFLMDGFYHCLPFRRKRRIHFHHFMAEVHHEMKLLAHMPDPLIALADTISHSTRLLCLDELHVDDIADAMILGRLLGALFKRGVVLLTTSNYAPDDLYPNGLQRERFLPAIALMKQELKVLQLAGDNDYRMMQMVRDPIFMGCDEAGRMASLFERLTAGATSPVDSDLRINARRASREIIWFDFKVLCGGNHDQADYLLIAHRYHTVFLSDVPRMTQDNASAARRFTWLIDVFYDNHVKLVASFAVVPEHLYEVGRHDSESQRITSRLTEMQTTRYLETPHHRLGEARTELAVARVTS